MQTPLCVHWHSVHISIEQCRFQNVSLLILSNRIYMFNCYTVPLQIRINRFIVFWLRFVMSISVNSINYNNCKKNDDNRSKYNDCDLICWLTYDRYVFCWTRWCLVSNLLTCWWYRTSIHMYRERKFIRSLSITSRCLKQNIEKEIQ